MEPVKLIIVAAWLIAALCVCVWFHQPAHFGSELLLVAFLYFCVMAVLAAV